MNILIINGSRNHHGQTATAALSFQKGLKTNGADVENVFLPEENVSRCRQCDLDGWGRCRSKGKCIIEDDLVKIADKIHKADGIVFATPVYFGDLSESMKAFTDRFRRTYRDNSEYNDKKVLGIAVAGGGGGGSYRCIDNFSQILGHCGFDVLDMVPVRRQNLELKKIILEETGKWFVNKLL